MTDKEIKKALECCGNVITSSCKECSYHSTYNANCVRELMRNALDLLNRQQAEIEKQKRKTDVVIENYQNLCDRYIEAGAEAIKEFAERLKEKQFCFGSLKGVELVSKYAVEIKDIDNLVKEMVGDDK